MYCVNCGVELAATEGQCPLCGTAAAWPAEPREAPLYPPREAPRPAPWAGMLALSILYLIPAAVVLLCDLGGDGRMDWADLALGGLGLAYLVLLLPRWFRKPHPAVFVPCDAAGVGLYFWYIAFATGRDWFWPFALPVTALFGLWVTAMACLLFYLPRGRIWGLGGGTLSLSGLMPLLELLIDAHFVGRLRLSWSLYPAAALGLLGLLLLFLGICRPAREALERRFFF